jgi:hypothetical protein
MIEFLKGGKTLKGVEMGMTIDDLHSILGKPTNISGEKNYGYIHYREFRYGFTDDIINEMAIEFKFIKEPFIFKNLEWKKYDISLFEDFKIKSKSKIHKILSFINHLQLNWKAQNGIDKDCLTIKIENGPYIVFNLYDGTVDKITVVDGHQKD